MGENLQAIVTEQTDLNKCLQFIDEFYKTHTSEEINELFKDNRNQECESVTLNEYLEEFNNQFEL